MGSNQSFNRFAYVNGTPLSATDPFGLDACFVDGAARPGWDKSKCASAHGDFMASDSTVTVSGTPDEVTLEQAAIGNVLQLVADLGDLGQTQTGGGGAIASRRSTMACAADNADKVSLAGAAHALGVPEGGAAGFVTDALGGNAFSGAVHLVQSFGASGMGGGHSVFYNMGQGVLAGPSQGLLPPGVGPVS